MAQILIHNLVLTWTDNQYYSNCAQPMLENEMNQAGWEHLADNVAKLFKCNASGHKWSLLFYLMDSLFMRNILI